MSLATVKTDINGFDLLLGGGIPKGSTLLISGPPGAGKTVMALQYTFNQARKGERVLFVSTCELLYTINKFASSMSFFDLGLIRTGVNLDFYGPKEEGGFVEFWDYSLGPVLAEHHVGDIFDVIQDKVSSHHIDQIIVDSITSINLFLGDEAERGKKLLSFLGWASRSGCTTIFTAESGRAEGAERLLADGIIDMKRLELPGADGPGVFVKTIEVVKLRGQAHAAGRYLYNISADGIHIIYPGSGEPPAKEAAKTGIADLDGLLGGVAYSSIWHFKVDDAVFYRPMMNAMFKETLTSGDGLIYVALPDDVLSLEFFHERFGPESELKGRFVILDLYGLQVPDKLKDLVVAPEKGKYSELVDMLKSRICSKGKRCRMFLDIGALENALGPEQAEKGYSLILGLVREKDSLLFTFAGPMAHGALLNEAGLLSDGIIEVRDYGGYALLHVKKAPYSKSFEPYNIRLENGRIVLRPL